MKLIDTNWNPTDRQLRQFGVICLFALPVIGWLWGAGTTTVITLAAVGGGLACLGLALPKLLGPVFLLLMLVATPIGMVIGELAMLAIYFGMFLPFGIVFRLLKRDALQLSIEREKPTYWQAKKQPAAAGSYYRQS